METTYSTSVTCAPLGGLPHVFALFMTQPCVAWGHSFFPWDGCLTLCSGWILFTTGTAIQDFGFSSLFSLWPQAFLTAHYSNPALKTTSFCFLVGFSIALMTIVSKCLIKINSSIFATAPAGKLVLFSSFYKCWTESISPVYRLMDAVYGAAKTMVSSAAPQLLQAAPAWSVRLHLASVCALPDPLAMLANLQNWI